MSRIYLVIAGLFVLAGVVASLFAPTGNMGTQEAFYAHLILIAPPLLIGTVISALAVIIGKLERLLEAKEIRPSFVVPAPEIESEDFGSLFAEKLRTDQGMPAPLTAADMQPVFEELAVETGMPAFEPLPAKADERRAPTVDEFLVKGEDTQNVLSSKLAREGMFAGRSYRMYEDGSMEIDTDQSTIRFDSLDEFRSFVSSAAAG